MTGIQSEGSGLKPLKVHIAGGTKVVRNSLKGHLADFPGIEVSGQSETAEETLDACRRTRPDVLILDLDLKGGNGLDTLKAVKSEIPATRVVIFSGSDYPPYRERCFELGADYFFRKTEEYEGLVDLVSALSNPRLNRAPPPHPR